MEFESLRCFLENIFLTNPFCLVAFVFTFTGFGDLSPFRDLPLGGLVGGWVRGVPAPAGDCPLPDPLS